MKKNNNIDNETVPFRTKYLVINAVLTFIFIFVGATFAYFTAVVKNDVGSSVIVKTALFEVIYREGNDVNIDGAMPIKESGVNTGIKYFTVTNNTPYSTAYKLVWKPGLYNSIGRDELVYSMRCTGKNAPSNFNEIPTPGSEIATTESYIIDDGTDENNDGVNDGIIIPGGVVHSCTVTFKFIDTNSNQNYNQGKLFAGQLAIEPVEMNG